jgi:hypothetical protein
MTEDDDLLLQDLARLPSIPRDIERESRVRARCHQAMNQGRKRPVGARVAWLAAAAALCLYLAAMFSAAAQLGGFL